jgi:predicted Zn-dependent peptidase
MTTDYRKSTPVCLSAHKKSEDHPSPRAAFHPLTSRYTLSIVSSIRVHQLSCGTPLILEHVPGVRSASINWLLPAGAAFDPPDRLGLATILAEILMRGAGSLDSRAQADAFDRVGASRATDAGGVTFRIASTFLADRLPDVLPLLVDMALRPRVDYDAIDPAKDLALQALDSLRDVPQERASLLLRERHMPPPLDRSGLGTPDGIAAIEREDLVGGWFARARPRGSFLAIAGAIDPDRATRLCEDLLGTWEGANPEPPMGLTPPRGYHHEHDDTNQVQILVAHDAPPEPHPDSLLERIVLAVLSGGMAGRLFSEVREKRGLCYSVSAGYRGDRDYGVVSAYVGTTPDRAQESLDVLWEQLLHILSPAGAVTPEEFDRARVGLKSGVVFSGESTAARAASLASDMRRLGAPRSLAQIADAIDAVTLDQVNAYLARRRLGVTTIVTLGPKPLTPPKG